MKPIYYFCFLFVLLTNSTSAQIASDTLGCVPLRVQFRSPNASISNPVWDFGDGASSFILNPEHIYISQGTYVAKLSSGGTTIASVTIKIYPKILPTITADRTVGCAPLEVRFIDLTSLPNGLSISKHQWDFGDGEGSDIKNPTHIYTFMNDFDVSLTIMTNVQQCDATATFSDYIKVFDLQTVSFIIDSIKPGCELPATAYFKNTTIEALGDTYLWDFGNGKTSTLRQPDPVIYTLADSYEVSLTVTNTKGCVANTSRQLQISALLAINVAIPSTFCADKSYDIEKNLTFGDNYFWQFGTNSTSTERFPKGIRFSKPGEEEIYFRVSTSNGCMADTTFIVKIDDPKVDFTIDPVSSCLLEPSFVLTANSTDFVSYEWNTVKGDKVYNYSIASVNRDSFYYNKADSATMRLVVETAGGCFANAEKKLLHQLPNAQFSLNEFEGEVPYLLVVTDESKALDKIIRWIYTWGDGTSDVYDTTTIANASHLYEIPGRYYVNLSILTAKGCEDKYYGAWVVAHALPTKETSGPIGTCSSSGGGFICYNDTIMVSISNIPKEMDAANISMGQTLSHCQDITSFLYHVVEDPGDRQDVLVALENGGRFYEYKSNLVIKGPKAVLGYDNDCKNKRSVFFKNKSVNYTSARWIVNNEVIQQDSFNYIFPKVGDYEVMLIVENAKEQCKPDSVSKTIYIRDLEAVITTDQNWCAGIPNKLISSSSRDKITGCRLGSLWSFPKELKLAHIQTELDTSKIALTSGLHQIRLIVRDINGCLDTAFQTIEVHEVIANFTFDRKAICEGSTINFKDISIYDAAIDSFRWSINPGLNEKEITHTFDGINGKFVNVSLQVIDIYGCKSDISKRMEVYIPKSKITFDPIICKNIEKIFVATDFTEMGSSLNFSWILDGNEVSKDSFMQVPNLDADTKYLVLKIEEKATGCKNEYPLDFRIIEPPKAIISGILDSVYCHPKNLLMFGDSSVVDSFDNVKYNWYINNSYFTSKVNPVFTFRKGIHVIGLEVVSSYGCASDARKTITLVGPEGDIMVDKNQVCKGENITFTMVNPVEVTSFYWDFGQGEVANNSSPIIYNYQNVPLNGATFASLVMSSSDTGCEYIVSVPIEVYIAQANFAADTTCDHAIQIVNLSLGDNLYTWTHNGTFLSNDAAPIITFDVPGTYSISLNIFNSQFGCRDTIVRNMVFLANPSLDVPSDIRLCVDEKFSFNLDPQFLYNFEPKEIVAIAGNTATIQVFNDRQLIVTVTSPNGCSIQKKINVDHVIFDRSYTLQEFVTCGNLLDASLIIRNAEGDTVAWTLDGSLLGDDFLSCQNCDDIRLLKPAIGLLEAVIVNKNLCQQPTFGFNILDANIDIPNIFSPNNDNVNDVFRPVMMGNDLDELNIDHLKVVNRWGKEVFNGNRAWNGLINGIAAPAEVYTFVMSYSGGKHCRQTVTGDVTLMR